MSINQLLGKLAEAYETKDCTLMEQTKKEAKRLGLPDLYIAVLVAENRLHQGLDNTDIPSIEEEKEFASRLNNQDKFELLKGAIQNQRGFICDRFFSLKEAIPVMVENNGKRQTIYRYLFEPNQEPNNCSVVGKLYRELFWEPQLDGTFFTNSPVDVGELTKILTSHLMGSKTIEEFDSRIPRIYDSIFGAVLQHSLEQGMFDQRMIVLARALDKTDEFKGAKFKQLQNVYKPIIEKLSKTGNKEKAEKIAKTLNLPSPINYDYSVTMSHQSN